MEIKKGTLNVPFFNFLNSGKVVAMANEVHVKTVEQMMLQLLEDNPAYFLVDISVKPTNNFKIFLDADTGVSIDKCVKYNRALYKLMEEKALFPEGDFSLEISSPGIGEPLRMMRQYHKNIGRKVEVVLQDGVKIEGKLLEVTEGHIIVEEEKGKNKKKEIINHTLLLDQIKQTKIQIVF